MIVDAFDFARQGKEVSGTMPLARFGRACEGLPVQPRDSSGEVRWSVRGEAAAQGLSRGALLLHVHVQAAPVVVCQRCMEPFAFPINATTTLQLVRSEAQLGESGDVGSEGAGLEDEDPDAPEKVVGSRHFDLLAQVEDELILSIPYVPRHEVCPGAPAKMDAGEPIDSKRPSPFAALGKLKQKV
jgi:uncharacterized protein